MAINMTELNNTIAALTAQVEKTEGTEDSATALIAGFSAAITKAVTDALVADDAADQGSVDAAKIAIDSVTARFSASSDKLGAAVAANS